MTTIENLLNGFDIFEQRSALYYLGRYLKQADTLENYHKDIFLDGDDNIPNEGVVSLTFKLIELIEDTAKKKASEFTEEEYHFWMDKVSEIEDKIDIEPNEEILQKALIELNKFQIPKASDNG